MISFNVGTDKFNFRVSGIFFDKNKKRFLTNTREGVGFWVLPGGRVEMGEDSKTSLIREMQEELGLNINIIGIKAITENFFVFDNKNYHELQYIYIGEFVDKSIEEKTSKFYGIEEKDIFEWKNINDLEQINCQPELLKDLLKEVVNGNFETRHIINKE